MTMSDAFPVEHFPVGCLVSDSKRQILYCNRFVEEHYGYGVSELVGADLFTLLSRASQIMYDSYLLPLVMREGRCDEIRLSLVTRHGEPKPVVVSLCRDHPHSERIFWSIGNANRSEQLFSELTEARKLLQQKISLLHNLSDTDQLTGLPNRAALTRHLNQKIGHPESAQLAFALAFLDLDGFKEVNDRYGHPVGDKLLRLVAKRMAANLRNNDLIARFGGDEFVILLTGEFGSSEAEESLNRLIRQVSEPFEVESLKLHISASAGVTLYPQSEAVDADQLVRQADQAMYQAKLAGKRQLCLFNVDKERSEKGKNKEAAAVRNAIASGEFELFYQPKVNMRTGEVLGAEALLRWNHPDRGLLAPAAFLPALSQTSAGVELGHWVIASGLTQLRHWHERGIDLHVSVNIDGYHLQHPDFLRQLKDLLMDCPALPKHRLELEVLETSAIEDIDHVSSILTACKKLGIRISLDDFGTGYSSLAHLRDLSVDILKIDRSFVRDMLTSPGDLAILKGVIGFAGAFQCDVVAEGVETIQHVQSLTELGCDLGQGYYIAKPMPPQVFEAWLRDWPQRGLL
ncbi:EAL domain-containing protein [uncultured Marinobacter sp.]|uniref:sensor domain-containing protein n=1 Tax=uncultured Marinobacter sp. TaxID=187379 RepID=UPI0025911B49|nr:EAL domain-containing protein [uncultured Marinobacter sp.]